MPPLTRPRVVRNNNWTLCCFHSTDGAAVQTTPTCNEGLRWHVFNQHDLITSTMMQSLELLTALTQDDTPGAPTQNFRHNNRPVQPLNGRTVMFHNTGGAEYPGTFTVAEAAEATSPFTTAATGALGIVAGALALL